MRFYGIFGRCCSPDVPHALGCTPSVRQKFWAHLAFFIEHYVGSQDVCYMAYQRVGAATESCWRGPPIFRKSSILFLKAKADFVYANHARPDSCAY